MGDNKEYKVLRELKQDDKIIGNTEINICCPYEPMIDSGIELPHCDKVEIKTSKTGIFKIKYCTRCSHVFSYTKEL